MDDIKVTILRCLYSDCGHEWTPRFPRLPLVCPKCKRYDWNKRHTGTTPKGGKGNVRKRKRSKSVDTAIRRFKRQQNLRHGGPNDNS